MEISFQVKVWNKLLLSWHKRQFIIRENEFQLSKEGKKGKLKDSKVYPLINAVLVDQSKHNDLQILVGTSSYKVYIKPLSKEDKQKIITKLEERIKKFSSINAFSEDYLRYNEELLSCYDNSPYGQIMRKLNMFQNLILEMAQKLDNFKTLIQNKHGNTTNYMAIHNNLSTIRGEMKKQFDEIVFSIYNYHDQTELNETTNLTKKDFKENDKEVEGLSSSEEEIDTEHNINIEENLKLDKINDNNKKIIEQDKEENIKIENIEDKNTEEKNDPYFFLSNKIEDFKDNNYNFEKRKTLPHKIKCPKNIVKEMITNLAKRLPSPVYFNEPLSMGQRQCEKFKYLDLLIKAGNETLKEKQLCYIAAFIISELFLNIGRNLKPFSPIIGETYEFFDNEKNFRFYSEHVSHNPQINAYIGETPEFAYYGDTLNTTSFKIFKGCLELSFKNKIQIHIKKTGDHYIFNPPIVYIKGLMKSPIFNDYGGKTVIQNTNDTSYRCEIKFIEQGWSPNSIGNFEGIVFKDYETIAYLIKGNWKKEIYMTDPKGNNRIDLLKLDLEQEYLKNDLDSYVLPEYTCALNQLTKELEETLPKNDSRFRKDMRLLEEKIETDEAQQYKKRYEEKQRKELNNEKHKILFFTEFSSPETEDKYYIPNGKYWEYKKEGKLKDNDNSTIFDLQGY